MQCSLTRAEQEFIGHQSTALAAPVRNLSLEYFKTNHRQVSVCRNGMEFWNSNSSDECDKGHISVHHAAGPFWGWHLPL